MGSPAAVQDDGHRKSPMIEFARQSAEKAFYDKLHTLRQDRYWHLLANDAMALDFQTTIFQALSRSGGSLHQLLVKQAQQCPLLLLKLLVEPDVASSPWRTAGSTSFRGSTYACFLEKKSSCLATHLPCWKPTTWERPRTLSLLSGATDEFIVC